MRIDNAHISLQSQHQQSRQTSSQAELRAWAGAPRPAAESHAAPAAVEADHASISQAARDAAAQAAVPATRAPAAAATSATSGDPTNGDARLALLIRLVEALTGQSVRLLSPSQLPLAQAPATSLTPSQPPAASAAAPLGWGFEVDASSSVSESEQTSFSAQGTVQTADGQSLQFSLSLQMSYAYSSQSSVQLRAGDAAKKDPLVVNFGATAAQLTQQKVSLDLDGDGVSEQVSFVSSSSGFLALDKNGNGRIDNGSELFGAGSGNGFADLAKYDADGNGWIDANDAVFASLKVWSKDASGADQLQSLAQRGIGALYLGHIATPFTLKDANNQSQGDVRSSGVYLGEDGQPGSLQQIDLNA